MMSELKDPLLDSEIRPIMTRIRPMGHPPETLIWRFDSQLGHSSGWSIRKPATGMPASSGFIF